MNIDRTDLSNVESSMNELGRELESRLSVIKDKERKLMELEKAISETEKSYEIVQIAPYRLSRPRVSCPRLWKTRPTTSGAQSADDLYTTVSSINTQNHWTKNM